MFMRSPWLMCHHTTEGQLYKRLCSLTQRKNKAEYVTKWHMLDLAVTWKEEQHWPLWCHHSMIKCPILQLFPAEIYGYKVTFDQQCSGFFCAFYEVIFVVVVITVSRCRKCKETDCAVRQHFQTSCLSLMTEDVCEFEWGCRLLHGLLFSSEC